MLVFAGSKDMNIFSGLMIQHSKTMKNIHLVKFEGGHLEAFSIMSIDYPGSEYVGDIQRFLGKRN